MSLLLTVVYSIVSDPTHQSRVVEYGSKLAKLQSLDIYQEYFLSYINGVAVMG